MEKTNSIKNETKLRTIYKNPGDLAVKKSLSHLDKHLRHFINLSPFLVLSTVRPDGYCDASPRGDAPGFVRVLDDKNIFLPDRPGNNRLDSLTNILSNPGIGLLFMIPGLEETLRVNGKAHIISDITLLKPSIVHKKIPKSGLKITINECYIHCGKALRRSKIWNNETHIKKGTYPSIGKVLVDQKAAPGMSVKELDNFAEKEYKKTLY
jgi:PPOX class probable FMN-dependent enzyme